MVNISLLYLFENYFGWWYLAASTAAFMSSVAVSFVMQKYVTFRDRAAHNVSRQAMVYTGIALGNVVANALMMLLFVEYFHIPTLVSQIASAGIIAVWSLGLYKSMVFSHDV